MRGKVAKAIRKNVYGDYSIRGTKYRWDENTPGMVVCVGLRKQYKERKKLYNQPITKKMYPIKVNGE